MPDPPDGDNRSKTDDPTSNDTEILEPTIEEPPAEEDSTTSSGTGSSS